MNFKETLQLHLNSINSRDLDTYISTVLLDEIILIMPNGTLIKDGKEFTEFHKEWFDDDDWAIQYEILHLTETLEMGYALIDIEYSDCDEKGDPISMNYYLNLTFRKTDGKWLLVFDQNTIHK